MSKKETQKPTRFSNSSTKMRQNRLSHQSYLPFPLTLTLLPKYFNPFQQHDRKQLINSFIHDQDGKMTKKLLLNELEMLSEQHQLLKKYLKMDSIKKEIKAVIISRIQNDQMEPIHLSGEAYNTMKPYYAFKQRKNHSISVGLTKQKSIQFKKSKQLTCSLKLLQSIPSFAPFPQNTVKARINPEYGGLPIKEKFELKENRPMKRKEISFRRVQTQEEKIKTRISVKKNKGKCTKLSKSQLKWQRY